MSGLHGFEPFKYAFKYIGNVINPPSVICALGKMSFQTLTGATNL